jgi:DNA-binding LytR/AlgR family response regulator
VQIICLTSENEKDKIEFELSNFLYIESTGNYIQVYYLKDEKLKNTLLRSSLKRTEIQLADYDFIMKCHRAFLININKIIQVKGNSQGLKLIIKSVESEIPVSRNFSKSLKERMSSLP